MAKSRRPKKKVSHALRGYGPTNSVVVDHVMPLSGETMSSRAMEADSVPVTSFAEIDRLMTQAYRTVGVRPDMLPPRDDVFTTPRRLRIADRQPEMVAAPAPPPAPLQPGSPQPGKRKIVLT